MEDWHCQMSHPLLIKTFTSLHFTQDRLKLGLLQTLALALLQNFLNYSNVASLLSNLVSIGTTGCPRKNATKIQFLIALNLFKSFIYQFLGKTV